MNTDGHRSIAMPTGASSLFPPWERDRVRGTENRLRLRFLTTKDTKGTKNCFTDY